MRLAPTDSQRSTLPSIPTFLNSTPCKTRSPRSSRATFPPHWRPNYSDHRGNAHAGSNLCDLQHRIPHPKALYKASSQCTTHLLSRIDPNRVSHFPTLYTRVRSRLARTLHPCTPVIPAIAPLYMPPCTRLPAHPSSQPVNHPPYKDCTHLGTI